MECNKEEAIRAKGIAEKKMQCRDFVGARKFVLKAQQLFPDLENVYQMLTVCEVHCSSEMKVNGLEDWYAILQLEPTADELSIKKQYRKLALLLHPDKNKFSGSEAAFKLVVEAQRTLGDKAKRHLYDIKRRAIVRSVAPKPPSQQPNGTSYVRKQPAVPNSFANPTATQFTGLNQMQATKQQQTQATKQQQTQAAYEGAPTFWTSCPCCGIRYQYYRTILNKSLRCQNCLKPFIAYDLNAESVPPGANSCYPLNQSGIPQHTKFQSRGAHNAGQQSSYRNGSSSMGYQANVGGRPTTFEPCIKMGINTKDGGRSQNKAKENCEMDKDAGKENVVKFVKVKLEEVSKRERVVQSSGNPGRKRGRKRVGESSDSDSTDSEEVVIEESDHAPWQNGGTTGSRYPRRSTRQKQNATYNEDKTEDDEFEAPSSSKRLRKSGSSHNADRSNKASSEGDADEVRVPMGTTTFSKDMVKDGKKGSIPLEENILNGNECVDIYERDLREPELADKREEASKGGASSKADSSATQANPDTFSYPDPEFFDFEKDRDANRFAVDQVWAVYDNLDGMPRFYARIMSISSLEFKLRLTWLEHDPVGQAEMDWSDVDLPVACGNFRLGGTENAQDLPLFSHLMAWSKGARRNSYEIYPRKGEVWALFKGWDIKWCSDPDNHRQYEYEIVEVLSDFAVDTGVNVVYLLKVKGFVSLFCQEVNKGVSPHRIPSNEVLRFSHMVPSYRMTGQEREGIPEGSYELDSASLPINFEETFPSVSLDNVRVKVEDTVNKKNVPCSKSGTEKKSTNKFENPKISKSVGLEMNENIRKNQSLKRRGLSPEGLSGGTERKYDQANGSWYTAMEAGKNVDGETVAAKCQVDEKEKHFDTIGTSNSSTMENSNGSLPASPSSMVFEYPDSEFHNFESERSNGKFQAGQIWALYCDVDGFPKYYALIRKVDLEDFRVHTTWLEACPLLKEEIIWSDKDLPFGCGRFKLCSGRGGKETYDAVYTFSHLVQAEQIEKKQMYDIYPHIGEVWALYKNWSPAWGSSDMETCVENRECDVVEVLASSDSVMKVMILEKVDGFKAVFMPLRNKGNVTMMEIPRNEFLRFSHQIPSFKLTEERGGKLCGYWELDPASVPDVLLCTSTD